MLFYKLFVNNPEDRSSIPGQVIPKTKKRYLIPFCLKLTIIRYGSRVSGAIQGKELRRPLHLGVVAIKREPSGRPLRSANLLYTNAFYRRVNTVVFLKCHPNQLWAGFMKRWLVGWYYGMSTLVRLFNVTVFFLQASICFSSNWW